MDRLRANERTQSANALNDSPISMEITRNGVEHELTEY